VKAGFEKDKAALLVVLAALSNGQKVVLAVVPRHRESTASWSAVLRDLKARGLRAPRLVIGDGHLGIWAGLRNVYPEVEGQRCWNHKILNVLRQTPQAGAGGCQTPPVSDSLCLDSPGEAERRQAQLSRWCEQREHTDAVHCLERGNA
jgi:putative transposase